MLKLKQRIVKTKRGETRVWYIKGTCPYTGSPVRESAGTDSRHEAEQKLAEYLARKRDEVMLGPSNGTALFAEAIAEYIGKMGESRFLDPLLERFGKMRLRDIEDKHLTELGNRIYPGAKASTLVRQLYGPMQAVWNRAVDAKMVGPRKFAKPSVPKPRSEGVTEDWLRKLVRDGLTTVQQRATVLFMSFSACRSGEACGILIQHYDPGIGRILVVDTKNEDPREIWLTPLVNEYLQAMLAERLARMRAAVKDDTLELDPETPLFGYSTRFSIWHMVARGCERAKIKHASPHKIGRHTFAARFLADGHSLKALMEAGGWRSVGAVLRYSHLETSKVRQAVAHVSTPLSTQLALEHTQDSTVPKVGHSKGDVLTPFPTHKKQAG